MESDKVFEDGLVSLIFSVGDLLTALSYTRRRTRGEDLVDLFSMVYGYSPHHGPQPIKNLQVPLARVRLKMSVISRTETHYSTNVEWAQVGARCD